ncbi:hypothetical protein PP512_gp58 [Gordonia phage Denise]|uniref:Uncharacterized protein n=1 Tax=Gordonia phage Denise TaxID=2652879 RepID=A0A5P8DCE8_9CAUD|nr:hypothetical protein PP512_gp58 [Gordonia phage Denise]QFP96673.1 hypothetical protein SEA_DENISE_58 [Gordonia phage Denise]
MNATPTEIAAEALGDFFGRNFGEGGAGFVVAALSEHYHLLPKVEVKVWVENDAWVSDRGEEIVELFPADAEVWEVAEIEGQLAESLHEVRAVAAALASAADVAEVKP